MYTIEAGKQIYIIECSFIHSKDNIGNKVINTLQIQAFLIQILW